MIGRLNHVAIAVKALTKATAVYRNALGAKVTEPTPQPEPGVTVVFVELPNTKIEFLEPLGENSPIAKFVEKNPDGGIHHVCYEVDDIIAARDQLKAQGARVLGAGKRASQNQHVEGLRGQYHRGDRRVCWRLRRGVLSERAMSRFWEQRKTQNI